jgi:hypothetical protein
MIWQAAIAGPAEQALGGMLTAQDVLFPDAGSEMVFILGVQQWQAAG